jgi:hypothetical protein
VKRGWRRFGEARLYLAGASAALFVLLWSVLFARDHNEVSGTAEQAQGSGTSRSSTGSDSAQTVPHTKTRGS